MSRKLELLSFLVVLLVSIVVTPSWAATLGQVDDFEDSTVENWSRVFASVDNIADGGPQGADDNYLQFASSGGNGPGSRLVAFNLSQWAGDYISAGVTAIAADVNNLGSTDLDLRIAFGNASNSWYASTDSVALSAGSGWQNVVFDLSQVSFLPSSAGSDDLTTTLGGVTELRILSSALLPTVGSGGSGGARGDVIAATLGIDNITAIPEPSTMVLSGFAVCIGMITVRRNK